MTKTEIFSRFRQYLCQAGRRPGDRLDTEVKLAGRFGVSRSAMREVLMHFVHLGVLVRVKNKGTFIRQVSPEQVEADLSVCFELSGFAFEELKEARLCLETSIVPLLVRRITPRAVGDLRDNLARMAKAAKNPKAAEKLDREFHLLLLGAAGNRILQLLGHVIHLLFRRGYRQRFLNPKAARRSLADHRAILASLQAGDCEKAGRLLMEHIAPT